MQMNFCCLSMNLMKLNSDSVKFVLQYYKLRFFSVIENYKHFYSITNKHTTVLLI